MSATRSPLEERFLAIVVMELKRQGVLQEGDWYRRIAKHTSTIMTTVGADGGRAATRGGDRGGGVLEVDLSGLHAGDKIGIAVLEAFLRLNNAPQASDLSAGLTTWHLALAENDLTDRVLKHMELLVMSCVRLGYLDVSSNNLSVAGVAELQETIAQCSSQCEVVFTASRVATRRRNDSLPSDDGCTLSSSLPNHGMMAARKSLSPETHHIHALDLNSENTAAMLRGRSPSTGTAASVMSRSTYASGGAEALRRRREELFGKSHTTAAPDMSSPLPTRPSPSSADVPTTKEKEKEGVAVSVERRAPSPSIAVEEVVQEKCDHQTPPRRTQQQQQQECVEAVGASPLHGNDDGGGGQHEPFELNDHLDVTANLNPIVDSVLDLNGLSVSEEGTLRRPHAFGDAANIWDVIEAYKDAAEQCMDGDGEGYANANVSSMRMSPSSTHLTGGAYAAITVLSISNNNLTEIQALPETLLRLDISRNKLKRIDGLQRCRMLTVLNARRNEIEGISGLEGNVCLAHLFLGRNRIKEVVGLAHLLLLETLDLSHNRLRTQSSIRALSLCSALRHVLIKGNPFLNAVKGNQHRPLLRNLCPTLCAIDDESLGPSRHAEGLQHDMFKKRHANIIDQVAVPRGGKPSELKDVRLPAFPVAPAPADPEQQNAMNLLHMLTRGVTTTTGYGNGVKAANTAASMARLEKEKADKQSRHKTRQVTAQGKPLRAELVKKLAEESKRYLETTIVARMTSMQQSAETSTAAGGGGNSVFQDNAIAEVMGYTNAPRQEAVADSVLRPYQPVKYRAPPREGSHAKKTGGTSAARQERQKSLSVPRDVSSKRSPVEGPNEDKKPHMRRSASQQHQQQQQHQDPIEDATQGVTTSYAQLYAAATKPNKQHANVRNDDDSAAAEEELPLECSPIGFPRRQDDTQALASASSTSHCSHEHVEAPRPDPAQGSRFQPSVADRRRLSALNGNVARTAEHKKTVVPRGEALLESATRQQFTPSTVESVVRRYNASTQAALTSRRLPKHAPVGITEMAAPQSVRTGAQQEQQVRDWTEQLEEDTTAVRAALGTVVDLLQAHRQVGMDVAEMDVELPATYIQERRRCVAIIQDSGMLSDTHMPMSVVTYYGFSNAELEGTGRQSHKGVRRGGSGEDARRADVLRNVHLLGDSKTCLKYMLLLMSEGKERQLQNYVDQIRESL